MKPKEVKKTVDQLAAEAIAKKSVEIVGAPVKGFGEYDGIVMEWDHYGERRNSGAILDINVCVHRNTHKEISFFIAIEDYKDNTQYLRWAATAEEAFAIKDLLDAMIADFKEKQKGESDGTDHTAD